MTALPPGIVKVTLRGAADDVGQVAAFLAPLVLERGERCGNHADGGGCLSLTLLVPEEG